MTPAPNVRAEALARLGRGESALLWGELADDLETPVAAFLKLGRDATHACLLESVEGGLYRGRYSAIGLEPDLVWRVRDGVAEVARGAEDVAAGRFAPLAGAPFETLRAIAAESEIAPTPGAPPLAAGLFGYLGYEMAAQIERLPVPAVDPVGAPDAILMRPSIVLVFDALRQSLLVFTPLRPAPDAEPEALFEAGAARLAAVAARLRAPLPHGHAPSAVAALPAHLAPTRPPEAFHRAVEAARAHIRAGDAFQIVPSQRFTAPFDLPPFSLYRALRRANPSPFLFFFNFPGLSIVGSSPEILTRVRDGVVTSRPIAGTRPRGATPAEDLALEAELLADPKERAEHLMLVDLSRNDVGRIAEPGSVKVTASFVIERYAHVMHIVSNVEGRLRSDARPIDALLATFPHGTVTGAPKVRAMEIIAELEGERRGVYAGGVGYLSAFGDLDLCIALRTGVIAEGTLHVRAGAGVVLDSDPEAERLETEAKARALFRAAAEAARFV